MLEQNWKASGSGTLSQQTVGPLYSTPPHASASACKMGRWVQPFWLWVLWGTCVTRGHCSSPLCWQ